MPALSARSRSSRFRGCSRYFPRGRCWATVGGSLAAIRPTSGRRFCAPRSRMAKCVRSGLGASFGWDHLGPKSLAAGPHHRPLKSARAFSRSFDPFFQPHQA